MSEAQLTLSLRRRLFYSILGGFAGIYFLQGTVDFVLACPIGGAIAAALFLAVSPIKGKVRTQGGLMAFLTIVTFPLLMLLFRVGHLGLYEPASPFIPFPVRLVFLLLAPAVVVFLGGRWLAQRHLLGQGR